MRDDIGDFIGFMLVSLSILILIGTITLGVGICVADVTYFERKAFAAITDCEVHRMRGARQYLSSKVVCVPINTRQDTTTIQVR